MIDTQLIQLKAAVRRKDWGAAGEASNNLRINGWKYADMVKEFGNERWEEIAQEIDEYESRSE